MLWIGPTAVLPYPQNNHVRTSPGGNAHHSGLRSFGSLRVRDQVFNRLIRIIRWPRLLWKRFCNSESVLYVPIPSHCPYTLPNTSPFAPIFHYPPSSSNMCFLYSVFMHDSILFELICIVAMMGYFLANFWSRGYENALTDRGIVLGFRWKDWSDLCFTSRGPVYGAKWDFQMTIYLIRPIVNSAECNCLIV